jgi:hypothetical protein
MDGNQESTTPADGSNFRNRDRDAAENSATTISSITVQDDADTLLVMDTENPAMSKTPKRKRPRARARSRRKNHGPKHTKEEECVVYWYSI